MRFQKTINAVSQIIKAIFGIIKLHIKLFDFSILHTDLSLQILFEIYHLAMELKEAVLVRELEDVLVQ